MLTVIDEYTRECLAIVMARRLSSDDVLQALATLFIEPGSPWENGYVESLNARLRDELLEREILLVAGSRGADRALAASTRELCRNLGDAVIRRRSVLARR